MKIEVPQGKKLRKIIQMGSKVKFMKSEINKR